MSTLPSVAFQKHSCVVVSIQNVLILGCYKIVHIAQTINGLYCFQSMYRQMKCMKIKILFSPVDIMMSVISFHCYEEYVLVPLIL